MAERSKLGAMLRGLQDAVQDASAVGNQHILHLLRKLCDFEQDAEGRLTEVRPKVVRMRMPGSDHVLDIPLLTLINPASYRLQQMEVEMSVRLLLDELKEVGDGNPDAKRGSYSVEVCPRSTSQSRSSEHVAVRLVFEATEQPEGLARAIEDLNRTIQTKRLAPSGTPPENGQREGSDDQPPDAGSGPDLPERSSASVRDYPTVTPFAGVRPSGDGVGLSDDSARGEAGLRSGDAEEDLRPADGAADGPDD